MKNQSKKQAPRRLFSMQLKHRATSAMIKATIFEPVKIVSRKVIDGKLRRLVYWSAVYEIRTGNGRSVRRAIGGENWLQALLMSVLAIHKLIPDSEEEDWLLPDGTPAWIFFPNEIPIGLGYAHFKRLRDLVKKEDREAHDKIEEKRKRAGY